MIGRLIKIAANEFLRRRHAQTGTGPRRLPPTSIGEAQSRAAHTLIRMVLDRFMKR
ncbi:hypothetical protein [Chenggangzhangella methanolivorans]|uniref:Uncharacterized protein n=1 Tax=Chenggangzhangella methanolivorans TaxID=1437009 RepID=A0A9E6RFQ3_9HYPH|nr:hypothetical protein [Chenggangzhangella methanolivorans]QZO00112.1 hypothetical protein K6K41_26760 [Chenggangzhangella methanolivorans]